MPNIVRRVSNMYHSMGVYMQITVIGKKVYGDMKYYPECRMSRQFADMLGQKTLTLRDLSYIQDMEINIVFKGEDAVPQGWAVMEA